MTGIAGGTLACGLIAILLPLSCRQQPPPAPVSFYHWRQTLDLSRSTGEFLKQARVGKLYVRFFDVDLAAESDRPVPLSELECRGTIPGGIGVAPVVFIAERVFRSACDPSRLAGKVTAKIRRIASRNHLALDGEIQIDCDWSPSSRDRFFAFLQAMRRSTPPGTRLSVTLRLHQVKFSERSGVPPADGATLMLYNMGKIESPAAGNSIIDPGTLRAYVSGQGGSGRPSGGLGDYPLPFNLALPIFRWGLVYRLDRLVRIVNDLGAEEVNAAGNALKPLGDGRFLCQRGTHLAGATVYPGDLLRLEVANYDIVRQCLRLVRHELNGRRAGLVFYHLDAGAIARFGASRILELARES